MPEQHWAHDSIHSANQPHLKRPLECFYSEPRFVRPAPGYIPSFACRPIGGVRGFRWGQIPGCYVIKFATHQALKLIAWRKLNFECYNSLQALVRPYSTGRPSVPTVPENGLWLQPILRVRHLELMVSGIGFRVSGSGLRVSDFESRV